MWNSFVMVFAIDRMIELLCRERPVDVALLKAAIGHPATVREAYAALPSWNFSSGFLSWIPDQLLVLRAANVEWSDCGTRRSIERTLVRMGVTPTCRVDTAA